VPVAAETFGAGGSATLGTVTPKRPSSGLTAGVVAALGVLAGLVACSSTTVMAAPTVAPADAGDGIEAGDLEAGADADAGRVKGCPGETPATYAWQPPVARQTTACTEADLGKLASAVAQKALVTERDIGAALGPACAACAIGRVTDATWRAVVSGHDGYIGNVGGCAILLGSNETCGKAIDRLSTCLITGCDGCADRKAQDACADQLTTVDGACAPALVTVRKECPAKTLVSAFDTNGVCQSFVQTIRLFCGPPVQDGG
jgi:hypothetical protein